MFDRYIRNNHLKESGRNCSDSFQLFYAIYFQINKQQQPKIQAIDRGKSIPQAVTPIHQK